MASTERFPRRTAFEHIAGEGAALYLRVDDGGTKRCRAWKLIEAAKDGSGTFVHESEALRIERSYSIAGSTLHLGSPLIHTADGDWTSSGVDAFRIVDVGKYRLFVVGVSPDGSDDSRWIIYRNSAAEPWFTDRATREAETSKPR